MNTRIMGGFPLRRCSWLFNPIVPVALSHKMFRWLDLVCLVPFEGEPLSRVDNRWGHREARHRRAVSVAA